MIEASAGQRQEAAPIIVCGLGHVGFRLVTLLRRLGEEVTVVTLATRDEWRHAVEARGARVLIGDARDARLLDEAGAGAARALIAATDQDLVNVEIALDARALRSDLVIVVRLFDQLLAQQLEATFNLRAFAVSALAAPVFAAAALDEQVVGTFKIDDALFVIGRLRIDESSPLANFTVREMTARHHVMTLVSERGELDSASPPAGDETLLVGDRVTVLGSHADWDRLTPGISAPAESALAEYWRPAAWQAFARQMWTSTPLPLRMVFITLNALIVFSVFVFHFALNLSLLDALYFVVTTVTTVGYGDITLKDRPAAVKLYGCIVMLLGSATIATLYSIITDFIVTARFQQLLGRQRIPQAGHTVVVGLGNVGYRVVTALRRAGARVVGIQRDPDREFVEAVRAHSPVVIGDARVTDTLTKAGVASARAIVAATGDDAVNLGVALAAKKENPRLRTVVRLFDPDFARKVKMSLDIDEAMGAAMIAAPTFVAAALYPDVLGAFMPDDTSVIIVRRCVIDDRWQGLAPSRLRSDLGLHALMVRRAGAPGFELLRDDAPLARGGEVLAVVVRKLVE